MSRNSILQVMREPLLKSKRQFFKLALILLFETAASLLMPQILANYIDNLNLKSNELLVWCAFGYCLAVLFRGCISVCNTFISETLGWKLCDYLRVDLFKRIVSFDVQSHKTTQEGDFLERIEGDINLLLGFFSTMMVDIISSLLMVIGVLVIFYFKYMLLGVVFTILSAFILIMFIKTQDWISGLWSDVREKETDVLDEFSQDIAAYKDIIGAGKKQYVKQVLKDKFNFYEKANTTASFLGNVPSTIFFSLVNVGEGIVLIIGIYLFGHGKLSMGEIYLVLSYVGLLNIPFFNLKYEFAQMPKVLAALRRINDIYKISKNESKNGNYLPGKDRSVVFDNVSFEYNPGALVLDQVSFVVESSEHVAIEGRTGSGKSTILQLIAGFYVPVNGKIIIGGRSISEYQKEGFNHFIYYILQNYPILEDTIRNNVTRYDDKISDEKIREALKSVKLNEWLNKKENGLNEILYPGNVTQDEAQLIAWAGAILRNPGILLIDEFDAVIHEDTIKIIDQVISEILKDTTVIMVTHQKRSDIDIHKNIIMDSGKLIHIV